MLKSTSRLAKRVRIVSAVLLLAVVVVPTAAMPGASVAREESRAAAKEPYVFGATVDISGPAASTYAAIFEGLRVYANWLNASGGVNGHPIRFLIRDNRSDPATVSADVKFFIERGTTAVFYATVSGTIASYVNAMEDIPTFYGNACYPPSTPPKPRPNFFCVGISPVTDAKALVHVLFKQLKGQEIKLAMAMEDIPGCRVVHEKLIGPDAEKRGAKVVASEVVPLSVTNMDTVARKIIQSGANAVIHYCLSTQNLNLARSLHRFGFKGMYLSASNVPGLKPEMAKIKAPSFYAIDWFSLPSAKRPIWGVIAKAARKYQAKYPVVDLGWGWSNGIVIKEALTKCGFPCPKAKLLTVLNSLEVSSKDYRQLMFTPLSWTATNHTSFLKGYQLYRWSPQQKGLVPVFRQFEKVAEIGMASPFG